MSHCQALHDLGLDVQLVAGQRELDAPVGRQDHQTYAKVRRLLPTPGLTGYGSWEMLALLWRKIGASDVVHIHFARDFTPLLACLFSVLRRKPTVIQCHGMITPYSSPQRRFFDRVVTRPLLRRVSLVLTYDEQELAGISKVAGRSVPNATLLNGATLPDAWSHNPPRSEDGRWIVNFAARLHPRKRVSLFLEAARMLHEQEPHSFTFVAYGPDGGDLAMVEEAARRGLVTYGGALSLQDLRHELCHAHVHVLPSVNEPFSVTILDAQARGCPVVVSDTNGFQNYVRRAESGAVFASDDAASLCEAIRAVLTGSSEYTRMRESSRELVRSQFTWEAVAERLYHQYRLLAS